MSALASAASSDFPRFDPGPLIAAVNELLPLGKHGALAAIENHLAAADRSKDPQHGLFLVLRLLFQVPASGFHPPMFIGIPKAVEPSDPKSLPYFPLLVVDDIPLLLITTFVLGGAAQPVEAHLRYYRETGTLRAAPLAPPAPADRAQILSRAAHLYRLAYGEDPKSALLEMLEGQLQRWSERGWTS